MTPSLHCSATKVFALFSQHQVKNDIASAIFRRVLKVIILGSVTHISLSMENLFYIHENICAGSQGWRDISGVHSDASAAGV